MENNYSVYEHVTPDGMYYFGQSQNVEKRWEYNGYHYKRTSLQPYIEREKLNEYQREYQREYYEKNREKLNEYQREYQREYYEKNREKLNDYQREYQRQYRRRKKEEKQHKEVETTPLF